VRPNLRLRKLIRADARRWAQHDLQIAEEWFALEEEAAQLSIREDPQRRPRRVSFRVPSPRQNQKTTVNGGKRRKNFSPGKPQNPKQLN